MLWLRRWSEAGEVCLCYVGRPLFVYIGDLTGAEFQSAISERGHNVNGYF